jgi:hypothetical protein
MTGSEDQLLTTLLDVAESFANRIMVHDGRDLFPTWVLVNAKHEPKIVGTPWADETQKSFYRAVLKRTMKLDNIIAYSFITEAWAATVSQDEWKGWARHLTVSERQDRREVVIACAASASSSRHAQWTIERNELGKVTALVSTPIRAEEAMIDSWLARMLK